MEISDDHDLSIFLPTTTPVARRMLELAEPQKGDALLDIGSGWGSIVIEAAESNYRFGRIAGIECIGTRVKRAMEKIRERDLEGKIEIIYGDALKIDLVEINPQIVTMYLTPRGIEKIRPKLEREIGNDARVVSNSFKIEGWKYKKHVELTYGAFGRANDIYVYKMGEI